MCTRNCNPGFGIIDRIHSIFTLIFGSEIEIKVDPANLRDAAEQVTNKIRLVQGRMESMNYAMRSMDSYWSGKTFESREEGFRRKMEEMQGILEVMSTYSQKLRLIAQSYINAEEDNAEKAETLPVNVIS